MVKIQENSSSGNGDLTLMEPLPVPSDASFTLKKLAVKTAFVFVFAYLFTGIGAAVSFTGCITLIEGLILGPLVGAVIGLIASFFLRVDSALVQYRQKTLAQMEEKLTNPYALKTIKNLKKFFENPLRQFAQNYAHHALHHALAVITDSLDPQREDMKKVWQVFLTHLDKTKVYNAQGREITLDFSLQLERLEGKKVDLETQWLKLSDENIEEDLKQIVALQQVSLHDGVSIEKLKELLRENPKRGCLVVRRKGTREILGFAQVGMVQEDLLKEEKTKGQSLCIKEFTRKASAARLGVGELLMKKILAKEKRGQSIHLQVRESNLAAKNLYEKFGLVATQQLPLFYKNPSENALFMHLDWARYEQIQKDQQKVA